MNKFLLYKAQVANAAKLSYRLGLVVFIDKTTEKIKEENNDKNE
jgi:hypothetical protein